MTKLNNKKTERIFFFWIPFFKSILFSGLAFTGSSIPVCSFNDYVSSMHANQNSGFWQKFQNLSDKCSLGHSLLLQCHSSSKDVKTLRSSENTSCTDDGGKFRNTNNNTYPVYNKHTSTPPPHFFSTSFRRWSIIGTSE